MSPFEQFLQSLVNIQLGSLTRLFISFSFFLYLLFAFIIIRQVNLMSKTLVVPIDKAIKIMALVHLGLAIFSFVLTLIIL